MSAQVVHVRRHPAAVVSILVLAGLVGVSVHRPVAAAAGDGVGTVDIDTITAQVRYDAPPTQASDCWWAPMRGVDPITATNDVIGTHREMLHYKVCDDRIVEYRWITLRTTETVRRSSSDRVSRAVNMLLTRTAPPADKALANNATWFWVPRTVWRPVEVTAWIETPIGPVSVTTTATPDRLQFTPGDGSAKVDCAGPGRAWTSSFGPDDRSPCAHVYRSASHGGANRSYRARMAVRWKVRWRSNLGTGGPLPSITTGIPMTVRVREVQALAR